MVQEVDAWVGLVLAVGMVVAFLCWIQYTLYRVIERQTNIVQLLQQAIEKPSPTQTKTLEVLNKIAGNLERVGYNLDESIRENRADHNKFLETFSRFDERTRRQD